MVKEEMKRYVFPPGEEPQVLVGDLCVESGHEQCPGHITQDGELVFCGCWCHKVPKTEIAQ